MPQHFLSILLWWFHSQNLQCSGPISLKTLLIFLNNFLYFRFDKIEKHGIINLSSYNSKRNAFIVLSDSKITFLRVDEEAVFCLFHFAYRQCCITGQACQKFSCLTYFRKYFVEASNFFTQDFFSTASSFSNINWPCLMSSWISINFDRFVSDFRRVSELVIEMFFPLLWCFFLADCYSFSFQDVSPSSHLIYLLLCSLLLSVWF